MPTPAERNALLFFAVAVALGAAARVFAARAPAVSSSDRARDALTTQIKAVEASRVAARPVEKSSSGPAPPVDVDRATAAQLQSLPRVGPVLASRIIAHRDSLGSFGSLEWLDDVKGIGPALLKELAPRVTFSTTPRPRDAPTSRSRKNAEQPRTRDRKSLSNEGIRPDA